MAFKYREEIVGKRFLSVRSQGKLKLSKISEWDWRAGVIRAVTHKDPSNPDISVLVEFDDTEWQRREWIRIAEIFQIFLVENSLASGLRHDPYRPSRQKVWWPGLTFKPLVDKVAYRSCRQKAIEYLGLTEHRLAFSEEVSEIKPYKDSAGEESVAWVLGEYAAVQKAVRSWVEYQDGQSILLTTPSVLVGYRVQVYRSEGTTQWYTAVIQSYNDNTRELSVTDDTVLEEHNEDPSLVQMRLIGDGVVDSILKGVDVGITPRRRACNNKDHDTSHQSNNTAVIYTRNRSQSPSHSNSTSRVSSRKARGRNSDIGSESEKEKEKPSRKSAKDRKRKSTEPVQTAYASTTARKLTVNIVKKSKALEKAASRLVQSESDASVSESSQEPLPQKSTTQDSNKHRGSKKHRTLTQCQKKTTAPANPASHDHTVLNPADDLDSQSLAGNSSSTSRSATFLKDLRPVVKPLCSADVESNSVISSNSRSSSRSRHKKSRHTSRLQQQPQQQPLATEQTSYACDSERDVDSPAAVSDKLSPSRACSSVASSPVTSLSSLDNDDKPKETETVVTSLDTISISSSTSSSHVVDVSRSESLSIITSTYSHSRQIATCSTSSSRLKPSEPTMHFKKGRLLGDGFSRDKDAGAQSDSSCKDELSASINVNHSVTDQIAKLSSVKGEKLWTDEGTSGASASLDLSSRGNGGGGGGARHEPARPHSNNNNNNEDYTERKLTAYSGSLPVMMMKSEPKAPDALSTHSMDEDRRWSSRGSSVDCSASQAQRPSSQSSVTSARMPAGSEDARKASKDTPRSASARGNSPASSPLVLDKSEHVTPYRDPELLKRETEVVRHIHPSYVAPPPGMQQRHHTHTPQSSSSYPGVHTPIPTNPHSSMTAPSALPQHLMSPAYYQALPGLAAMNPHLVHGAPAGLEHSSLPGLRQIAHQQQLLLSNGGYREALQAQFLQQQSLLSSYPALHANVTVPQLEMLWQQKYPTIPVPPTWMLTQYQDELLRDHSMLRERELVIERERREREMALEREQRERAERERERERLEKERVEKERKEREEAELKQRELEARERLEQERKEQERLDREKQERAERERVLKESAAAAAVNQHFAESLRLASQKGTWMPSMNLVMHKPGGSGGAGEPYHGGPHAFSPTDKQRENQREHHQHAEREHHHHHPHHHQHPQSEREHHHSERHKAGDTKEGLMDSKTREAYANSLLQLPPEEKHKLLQQQQEQLIKQLQQDMQHKALAEQRHTTELHHQHKALAEHRHTQDLHHKALQEHLHHSKLRETLIKGYSPTQPASGGAETKPSPNPALYAASQGFRAASAGGSAAAAGSSSAHSVKSEPNFSLYGYQPFQHTFISQDRLQQLHGLNMEKVRKEESGMEGGSRGSPGSTPRAASSPASSTKSLASPPPLIRDQKGSVIVENTKCKDLQVGITTGVPPPRRTAPASSSSSSSSSPMISQHHQHPHPHPAHHHHHHQSSLEQQHHAMLSRTSSSQSPLRVASPQQLSAAVIPSPQQLSAAVMQPMDLHKPSSRDMESSGRSSRERGGTPSASSPALSSPSSSGQYVASVAGSPVSLPAMSSAAAYSFSLIQQGLVPNPIYSQNAFNASSMKLSAVAEPVQSMAQMAGRLPTPTSPPTGGQGTAATPKRRMQKEHAARKKPRNSGNSPPGGATTTTQQQQPVIPVTTPPIPSNPAPYTTLSSSTAVLTSPSTSPHHAAHSHLRLPASSGFMDSFRSFVENAVQNAFYQDEQLQAARHHPKGRHKKPGDEKSTATIASSSVTHVTASSHSVMSHQSHNQHQQHRYSQQVSGLPPPTRQPYPHLQHSASQQQTSPLPPPGGEQHPAQHNNNTTRPPAPPHRHSPAPVQPGQTPTPPAPSPRHPTPTASPAAVPGPPLIPAMDQHPVTRQSPQASPSPSITTASLPTSLAALSPSNVQSVCPSSSSGPTVVTGTSHPVQSTTPLSTVSSTASIIETINRVANGCFNDTDSDTLSAPSPTVPPVKNADDTATPSKMSSNHPKGLKKAWLQRHSDQDREKEQEIKTEDMAAAAGGLESKTEPVKPRDCYVNCSYISPTKEGGSKSPISMLATVSTSHIKELSTAAAAVVANRGKDDDSTSSASEAETQGPDQGRKRPLKTKRRRSSGSGSGSKKPKLETTENTTGGTTSSGKKKLPRKAKENKTKNGDSSTENSEKDKETKPTVESPDKMEERLKERKAEEEKRRQLLHDKLKDLSKQSDKPAADGNPTADAKDKEKKRGRKPKEADAYDKTNSLTNSDRPSVPANTAIVKPIIKPTIAQLKKSQNPFLQDGPCSEITPKLMKCRECKMTPNQRNKKLPNIFCRFYAFRRLKFSQKGYITIAGFSDMSDADQEDIDLWMPNTPVLEPHWDVDTAKYIITNVGDKFCELVEQEKEALTWAEDTTKIVWKKAVQGVREMCDVCDTTLFNTHWVCHKCGFVVCVDCYKVRTNRSNLIPSNVGPWLPCSANRQQHEPDKLMLTQIIPSGALWEVGRLIHAIREKWKIKSNCPCGFNTTENTCHHVTPKNGVNQLLNAVSQCITPQCKNDKALLNGSIDDHGSSKGPAKKKTLSSYTELSPNNLNGLVDKDSHAQSQHLMSPEMASLSLLADVTVASMDCESALDKDLKNKVKDRLSYEYGNKAVSPLSEHLTPKNSKYDIDELDADKRSPDNCSTLRELLTKHVSKLALAAGNAKSGGENKKGGSKSKTIHSTLDDIIQQVVERKLPRELPPPLPHANKSPHTPPGVPRPPSPTPIKLLHYIPKNGSARTVRSRPVIVHTLTETSVMYPDVPHSWLCDGRLLRLLEPRHKGNFRLFQQQWCRSQPVLVSGCDYYVNRDLWRPQLISQEFGQQENDLVNCRTGVVIIGNQMKTFWEGFENVSKRLTDDKDEPIILKLKDWPPTEDFADMMPARYHDLMQSLPLPEYTHRSGMLNLASRLPEFFVRPDLGPKLYNAYGSALSPREGSTNLHLDISDAVNLMMYVGIAQDDKYDHQAAALKTIDDVGCDVMTKRRVREAGDIPGALWHIYDPHDADKIRDLLNKTAKERGEKIEPHHDPIHDQSWYLNEELRERLLKDYGVTGYTIVQCMGDAVFIPAGAPHQVRNLHSCIKAAEDFVSPENLNYCFQLTQEFRNLSDTHSNHEDKLQVKNIIYHAVKDAVAILNQVDPDD